MGCKRFGRPAEDSGNTHIFDCDFVPLDRHGEGYLYISQGGAHYAKPKNSRGEAKSRR